MIPVNKNQLCYNGVNESALLVSVIAGGIYNGNDYE